MDGLELVIFDLDGTLIDNTGAIVGNFNRALRAGGRGEADPAVIKGMIGLPLEAMFMRTVPACAGGEAERLAAEYRKGYASTGDIGVRLLGGVPGILEELKGRGVRLAIVTSKQHAVVGPLLEKIGIGRHFEMVLGRTEGLAPKPNPDMINHVLREMRADRARTAMVGDSEVDVLAAKAAGVTSVAVLTGVALGIGSEKSLLDSRPDIVVRSLTELGPRLLAQRRRSIS